MKKISKLIPVILLTALLSVLNNSAIAQPGGVPDDPSLNATNGAVGHPQNGGATIDGGLQIFMLFAFVYGTKRYFQAKRKEKELADGTVE